MDFIYELVMLLVGLIFFCGFLDKEDSPPKQHKPEL